MSNSVNEQCQKKSKKDIFQKNTNSQLKEQLYLPILTNNDIKLDPPIEVLRQLKQKDLENIQILKIESKNKNSITFYEPTDITFVNFDKCVNFGKNYIEVYQNEENKPPIGQKLNKPAKLTFYIDIQNNIYDRTYYEELCQQQGSQFIFYKETENTAILEIEVPHFSKYGFNSTTSNSQIQQKQSSKQMEEENTAKTSNQNLQFTQGQLQESEKIIELQESNNKDYTKRSYEKKIKSNDNTIELMPDQTSEGQSNEMENEEMINQFKTINSDHQSKYNIFKQKLNEYDNLQTNFLNLLSSERKKFPKMPEFQSLRDNKILQLETNYLLSQQRYFNNKSKCANFKQTDILKQYYQCCSFRCAFNGNNLTTIKFSNSNKIQLVQYQLTYNQQLFNSEKFEKQNAFKKDEDEDESKLKQQYLKRMHQYNGKSINSLFQQIIESSVKQAQEVQDNQIQNSMKLNEPKFLALQFPKNFEIYKILITYLQEISSKINDNTSISYYELFNDQFKNEIFFWNLISILWGVEYLDFQNILNEFSKLFRRLQQNEFILNQFEQINNYNYQTSLSPAKKFEQLKLWLQNYNQQNLSTEQFNRQLQVTELIQFYLSIQNFSEAATIAKTELQHKLACIINSCAVRESRLLLINQIQNWQKSQLYQDIKFFTNFKQMTGDKDAYTNIVKTWSQKLGICIWFENDFQEISKIIEKDKAFISKDDQEKYQNIQWLLLQLYSQQQQKIKQNEKVNIEYQFLQLLHPYCFSNQLLDYKTLWILMQFLYSNTTNFLLYDIINKNQFIEEQNLNQIYYQFFLISKQFASQLENLNYWYYAIFVFISIPNKITNENLKINAIKEIIFRNYMVSLTKFINEIRKIVIRKSENNKKIIQLRNANFLKIYFGNARLALGINQFLKAIFYEVSFKYEQAYKFYLKIKNLAHCHDLLVQHILPKSLARFPLESKLSEQYLQLLLNYKQQLQTFKLNRSIIAHWGNYGIVFSIYISYLHGEYDGQPKDAQKIYNQCQKIEKIIQSLDKFIPLNQQMEYIKNQITYDFLQILITKVRLIAKNSQNENLTKIIQNCFDTILESNKFISDEIKNIINEFQDFL